MNLTSYLHNNVFDFVYKGTFCFFKRIVRHTAIKCGSGSQPKHCADDK